jgi:pimeloyl-ACP methyl ester carboxylesterase
VPKILLACISLLALLYAAIVLYAYWPRSIADVKAEQLAAPDDRFAPVPQGLVRYRLYGDAATDTTAFVLIHGFANNLHSFRYLAPLLAKAHPVMALDLPGFGLSSKPAERSAYTYKAMADAAVAAARHAGFTRTVYVGHSLGGVIALRAALSDDQSAGMILIEPGIYAGNALRSLSPMSMFPLPRLAALQFADREFRTAMISRAYKNPALLQEKDIDQLMLAARTNDYLEGMTALMSHVPSGQEELDMLPGVTLPAIAFWASAGSHVPADAVRLQNDLPRLQTIYIDDAGHYLHEEQPETVAQQILRAFDPQPESGDGS